jgi:hypothetical protein
MIRPASPAEKGSHVPTIFAAILEKYARAAAAGGGSRTLKPRAGF